MKQKTQYGTSTVPLMMKKDLQNVETLLYKRVSTLPWLLEKWGIFKSNTFFIGLYSFR